MAIFAAVFAISSRDYGCIDYVEHWRPYRTIKMLVIEIAKDAKTFNSVPLIADDEERLLRLLKLPNWL